VTLRFWLTMATLVCAAAAQEPTGPLAAPSAAPSGGPLSPSPAAEPADEKLAETKPVPAQLEGFVLNDSTGQPLRRAHVVLRPMETGLSPTGSDADDQGHFLLRDIPAGQYSLAAERDGFLTSVAPLSGGQRMPASFHLGAGDKIADLLFRLRPWAVMAGRVRYDDGEFGVGVRVELYRTDHIRGRNAYSLAASTTTNDRGEFRIYGLAPGAYLIASVYNPPAISNYREQATTDSQGRELPLMGYATTFFPNTELMSQAVPVRVEYGQELAGLDLSLRLARKVTISGHVVSAVSGADLSGAAMTLERVDRSGQGTMTTNVRVNFDGKKNFQIPGVSPGSYSLYVRAAGDGGSVLVGHALLVVGSEDVENLEVIAAPLNSWPGRIVTEGPGALPSQTAPRITAEPRSMNASICTSTGALDSVAGVLGVRCDIQRDETYDVFAENLPDDFYLSAVRVGGVDVKPFGLPGSLASGAPFEVVLDSRGGRVSGAVAGQDGAVWGGANLMLIPDPPQRRVQDYRFTSANVNGRFLFHGVAPGNYTLVAWLDETPCDVYDPDGLDRCRASGTPVTVAAGVEQTLVLTVRP
jgi:hypothetical protein